MDNVDYKLMLSIVLGLVTAFLLSSATTIQARLASITAGLFCAIFLTSHVVEWAGIDGSVYTYAVSGLLAMSGDRLVRRLFQVIDIINVPLPWEKR